MTPISQPTVEARFPFRGQALAMLAVSDESRLDIQYCALLLLLTAIMVLPGGLSLPMEVYDESRNANNAMEMASHGDWMAPTFGFVPDHWNTKPPFLIWIMAVLLRIGINPMLAIRLPSFAATMASVLLVYGVCRVVLKDRLAGVLGGLLTTSSLLFMGDHVGRTGDYDALLSLFSLGFVLCVGRHIDSQPDRSDDRRAVWIGAGGILLFLAIMTKGIAVGMTIPGLFAYALMRGRLRAVLRDWRLWVAVAAVLAGVTGWLALREQLDPGYLAAAWYNDVSGRFLTALEKHDAGWWYYLKVLALTFQPAVLLLPTLLCMRRDRDPARRRLCLLMTLTATSWIIAISCAGTKSYWYVAPVVPLLAIALGVAITTFLRRGTQPLSSGIVIRPIIVTLCITFWYLNVNAPDANRAYGLDQVWYGPFLAKVQNETRLGSALIVDEGLPNDAGFQHYNPVARFFAEDAARRGGHVPVVAADAPIAKDATIITCDPRVRNSLKAHGSFVVTQSDAHCILGHLSAGTE